MENHLPEEQLALYVDALVLDQQDVGHRVSGADCRKEVAVLALAAVDHAMVEVVALGDGSFFEPPIDLVCLSKRR